jgi:ABC-type Fe3+/spermidine/putrescine transport system ATPase subunit
LQSEIHRIQKKVKVTTIYVTHSQDEAFAISDRVAIINDGVIEQVGTPEELYNNPRNEFVARFLGSGNIFRGEIIENNSGQILVQVNGNRFLFPGEAEIGKHITFSMKPEDVFISTEEGEDWVKGEVISITPQVGSFKVNINFEQIQIIALTTDENLVKHLREKEDNSIYFSFNAESIFIFQ